MSDPRIKVFKQISKVISSVIDIDNLFDVIIDSATKIMNAKASSLLLRDEITGNLYFYITTGEKGEDVKRYELKKGEGLAGWVAEHGQPLLVKDVREDPRWNDKISSEIGFDTYSIAVSPLKIGDKVIGVLEIIDHEDGSVLTEDDLEMLNVFADLAAALILKARIYSSVEKQAKMLREEINSQFSIIGESPSFKRVMGDCAKVAHSKATVLISGSCGTGKELIARYIHNNSPRKENPFVAVNCGAIVESLLESELFGHEKGSFTGADSKKQGLFEAADRGTIFLDEIGDMPLPMQVKLLRVLQEGNITHVGGINEIEVDVRVVAASNKDLAALVAEGLFREDLYYRLNVVGVKMPNLADRQEDIPLLANHFLQKAKREVKREVTGFAEDAIDALKGYHWPGNVRQLENVVERAVIMGSGVLVKPSDLPYEVFEKGQRASEVGMNLKDGIDSFKRGFIIKTLDYTAGSKTKAAEVLGIQRTYLSRLIKELDI